MRTTIDIDTGPFVRSHMHEPRGRGSYAFTVNTPDYRDVNKEVQFTPSMTYRDAKVWIKAWFRDQQAAGKFPSPANLSYVVLYAQP